EGQRPSRMDVIPAGPSRRRWSAEAKARIIASSFEPGANIAEIARTHGLLPQQLYAWRHDSIPGKRLASKKLGFVPAVVEDAGGSGPADGGGDEIVIRTARLAIHVPPGASEDHIARVLAAVSRSG
ncbi:transposase, partial [Sphingobium yanoikuyae]